MSGDGSMPDGTRAAFRKQVRKAGARYRLERMARASGPIAWTLAATLLILLALSAFTPVVFWNLQIVLALLLLSLACALIVYRARPDRHRLFTRMDAHAKLPDAVLSSGDWENAATGDPWRERQQVETIRLLENIDWRKIWPIRWPRWLGAPLVCSALLIVVLGMAQRDRIGKDRRQNLAVRQENAPVPPEQLKPLEQVFQDWDDAQKIAPSPELAELLKQIQPMRDRMASGKMTRKDLFLKLNELQARLQAAQERLDASSLEPAAASMAEAMKNLDGMSGLAAALQRKDFAAARDQAAQAQDKYNSGAAKMPEGAEAQTAANRLGEAAQKASNDTQASSSLRQMQNAASNQDGSGMGKGLGGLKQSLGQEAQRQSQGRNLGLQLAQLNASKNGMGQGDGGIKMGLPQLSLAKSLQLQKGAGSAIDPNRTGPATQLDAVHQEMKITGTAGPGSSETQTEATNDPHLEKTAAGVSAAQFAAYEKLSEQATEDENLPVADRQTIKRYFEDIRPQSNP